MTFFVQGGIAMKTQSLAERTLTQIDYFRLARLTLESGTHASEAVRTLLENSELVASEAVPSDVITMYTQVLLGGDTGTQPHKLTLCYPADAEPSNGFISVLSPLGASLLGLRVGDVARWRTPSGAEPQAIVLEVLFQPEASGDYTT
jgi:regulator of nucleoside diphosphate kinase